jgi:uncharacterized membrane protein (DUF4010 family)
MPADTTPHEAVSAVRVLVAAVFVVIVAVMLLRKPRTSEGPQTLDDSAMWLAMLPALALGLGLFVLLPSWLAGLLKIEGGYGIAALKNLLEGVIRRDLLYRPGPPRLPVPWGRAQGHQRLRDRRSRR